MVAVLGSLQGLQGLPRSACLGQSPSNFVWKRSVHWQEFTQMIAFALLGVVLIAGRLGVHAYVSACLCL